MDEQSKHASGVREGDLLAGKYRIEKVLGAGGMGVVVAARHIHLDDHVAIKFLLPETLSNAEAVARFGREARAAVKIKSEHVARVSDVGTLENGAPYMVMEYLDGADLSGWLRQKGALPVEQAAEFVLQACEAIAEAHALGIVHRDLKPANLFVVRRPDGTPSVKVLDFGISKVTGPQGSASGMDMTKTSSVMGSPLYMSPEQMHSSKDVDARSDIWALGVILYELLSGDSPFTANTMPELVVRILSAPPEPLREKRPDAPPGIEAVILKCLERDRAQRYQNVAELALALYPFAPKRSKISVDRVSGVLKAAGISASTLSVPAPPSEPPSTARVGAGTAASWGNTASKPTNNTALYAGVTGGVMVAVIGAVLFFRHGGSTSESAAIQPSAPAPATALAAPEPPATATPAAATPETAAPAIAPAPSPPPAASASAAPSASAPEPPRPAARSPGHRVAPQHKAEAPAAPEPPKPAPAPAATAKKPSFNSLYDDRQ